MRWLAESHLLVRVARMPAVSKLRLSILLLFLQMFLHLYVVPRRYGTPKQEDPGGGFLLEEFCRLCYSHKASSPSGRAFFLELAKACGVVQVVEVTEEEVTEAEVTEVKEAEVTEVKVTEVEVTEVGVTEVGVAGKEHEHSGPVANESRSGNLIYQLIMVLLFVSVSFAVADCFQERAKKRANPDRHDGLSRRMSLADLTMSRHARRESQASYRPIGAKPQPLVTRSCSHDIPIKTKPVSRQTSCPVLEDDATIERRRVRMIQRH